MNPGMYSSNTGEWETPWDLFNDLNRRFHFQLDPCATPANAKCPLFYTKEDDGLALPWGDGPVFVNPPYGRQIGLWVEKGYMEAQLGTVVVMLLPARTDTRWWHDYVMRAHEVQLIRGRIRFLPSHQPAPFPSCIVIYWGFVGEDEPYFNSYQLLRM
jgi:site-specific DNA-methyltransferase (adenine-specific)